MTPPSVLPPPVPRATLADLMRTDGKAELINGEVVKFMASGDLPSTVALLIAAALLDHARRHGGRAYADGAGFAVPELPSGRESFSPDASYHTGPRPANVMDFIPGAPQFAVEVRSKDDYKPSALREQAEKRADYFAAGTLVVWDVDPLAGTVDCYRAADPLAPRRFGPGDTADAEPAVPGWRVAVDAVMDAPGDD